jgi:hypothetical protein
MRCTCIAAMILLTAVLGCTQKAENAGVAPEEAKEGFIGLFDGQTLNGWQGATDGYTVEDGAMVCKPGGNLYTAKQYANFVLRFEFRLPPAGNNGVGIRTPIEGDAAYVGMEIQILDDDFPDYKDLKPYQTHGSIYGVVPAKQGFLKPAGQWNREEIVADGSRVKVTLNGTVITETDLNTIHETPDGQPHPGLHNAKGHIGWLGHGHPVAFRDVRIKELP